MKIFNLHRLLFAVIFLLIPGMITAEENETDQAAFESQESIQENYHNQLTDYDLIPFYENNFRDEYVILDQRDNSIMEGWKNEVMIKYFIEISDFLIEVDNVHFYRLSYENEIMLDQRLAIK